MVGTRTSLNQLQKLPTIIRGGLFTVVGDGNFTEAPINDGGWATYRAAVGNVALIKGTIVLGVLGTNTFIDVTVFDTVLGRTVPIARINAANPKISFEVEVNRNFTMGVTGDNAADDGTCSILAFIQEVPA